MKKFLRLGNINVDNLINKLFWFGIVPILLYSNIFVNQFLSTEKPCQIIHQSNTEGTSADLYIPAGNSQPLGLLIGLIYLVSSVIIWRLVCEIIFIMVRYFKNNTNNSISN